MFSPQVRRWSLLAIFTIAFLVLLGNMGWWEAMLRLFFTQEAEVLYPGANPASLLILTGEHMRLVVISSGFTILIGVPLGVWVTRRSGQNFLPIVNDFTSFGQTFPPVAVLALAVPLFGFGLVPTVIALFLYGLLPVVRNTTAGLKAIPQGIVEVAYGMGMSHFETLMRVEIPLAAKVILAGIRTSVIINVGTAMVGAVIAAGGLGSPIIAGIGQLNIAWVVEGAVTAALLAILLDRLLDNVEKDLAVSSRNSGEERLKSKNQRAKLQIKN